MNKNEKELLDMIESKFKGKELIRFKELLVIDADTYLEEKMKAFSLKDVVVTLPKIDSNEFKVWLKKEGYVATIEKSTLVRKNYNFDIQMVYQHYINELQFGN